MNFSMDDEALIDMSAEGEKSTHYRRYMVNRFQVMEVVETDEGLCAYIADKEMGVTLKYKEGEKLADGKLSTVTEEGVVFQPPRADVPPFTLPMRAEMYPIAGPKATKDRLKIEDEIKMRYDTQGPVILMIDPDDMY